MHPGALPFHSYPINTEINTRDSCAVSLHIPMLFNVAEANGEERVKILLYMETVATLSLWSLLPVNGFMPLAQ